MEENEDNPKQGRSSYFLFFIIVSAFAVGFAVCYFYIVYSGKYISTPVAQYETDRNFDGNPDTKNYYGDDGYLQKSEQDLNYDGKVDCINYFKDGFRTRCEWDANFDGAFDSREYFNKEYLRKGVYDVNFDGKDDEVREYFDSLTSPFTYNQQDDYDFDGYFETESFYQNSNIQKQLTSFKNDTIFDRQIIFENNRRKFVVYDTNRDDKWDDTLKYDSFEKEIKK